MSYFIANSITFSKDLTQYKVKGGDNNVVPRSNYWSNWLPIERLYYNIDSGSIQIRSKTEKALFVKQLVGSMDFGGSWDDKTDYFHLHGLPKTQKELQNTIEEMKSDKRIADSKYYQDVIKKKETILEHFDLYRNKLDNFDAEFLGKL